MEVFIDFVAIGHRLRKIRKARGLAVKDAAELTGINSGIISAIELNKRNPGLHSLVVFARAYEVTVDEIIFSPTSPASSSSASPASSSTLLSRSSRDEGDGDEDGEVKEQDPYTLRFNELLAACDEREKEYLFRMCMASHNELKITESGLKYKKN